jgi:hypothetical protein
MTPSEATPLPAELREGRALQGKTATALPPHSPDFWLGHSWEGEGRHPPSWTMDKSRSVGSKPAFQNRCLSCARTS